VLLLDTFHGVLVRVDLTTGAWAQLAEVVARTDLAVEPSGSILLSGESVALRSGEIFRMDPDTGASALFVQSDPPPSPGAAPEFHAPRLTVQPNGVIDLCCSPYPDDPYVSDESTVLRVDPTTGARMPYATLVGTSVSDVASNPTNGDLYVSTAERIVGIHPDATVFTLSAAPIPYGGLLAVTTDGTIVLDEDPGNSPNLSRVDPATGDRTPFATTGDGLLPAVRGLPAIVASPDGSLLGIECFSDTLLRFDTATGAREVAFDPIVGSGPLVDGPLVAIDHHGRITMASGFALVRIDPVSGDRSVLSGNGIGTGDALTRPQSLAVAPDDDLFVTMRQGNGDCRTNVLRVDAETGDRTVVSGNVGAGPFWGCPTQLAFGLDGYLYVTDPPHDAIFRVDPSNGNRTVVSDPSHGSGPALEGAALVYGADGALYTSAGWSNDPGRGSLLRVDLGTGDRVVASGDGVGTGPAMLVMEPRAVDSDGKLLVAAADQPFYGVGANPHAYVLRVDPATGDSSLVQHGDFGALAVMPAPEPDASAAALVAFVAFARRTRRTHAA